MYHLEKNRVKIIVFVYHNTRFWGCGLLHNPYLSSSFRPHIYVSCICPPGPVIHLPVGAVTYYVYVYLPAGAVSFIRPSASFIYLPVGAVPCPPGLKFASSLKHDQHPLIHPKSHLTDTSFRPSYFRNIYLSFRPYIYLSVYFLSHFKASGCIRPFIYLSVYFLSHFKTSGHKRLMQLI